MTSTAVEHAGWTAAGADTAAKNTYASIRKALEPITSRRDLDIFLQGSYANATNIRGDSDVDVVVMTRLTFQSARERLSELARLQFDALPSATFGSGDLRQEITNALIAYYGAERVHPHNKCIKVDKRDGYVDADVVPSLQYRWYRSPGSTMSSPYVEGIAIHPLRGSRIINFPKEHIANGQTKNSQCGGRYKATVRQIKRLRNRAVSEGRISKDDAPGYLLECMTFNAPKDKFSASDSERLKAVVLWLKFASKTDFLSCDRIHTLFGTDPGNFSTATAQRVVDALWEAY